MLFRSYYKALQRNTTGLSLYDLLHRAPVFMHYHKPSDTWDKINAPEAAKLLDFIDDIALKIDSASQRIAFVTVKEDQPAILVKSKKCLLARSNVDKLN